MPTILIAEKEKMLRESITDTLNDYGYVTISVADGNKALSFLQERKPDLILSNIKMPELDGYEFLKFIKSSTSYINIPFIFLSDIFERSEIRYAMNLGADDYLLKPFLKSELLNTIQSNLRKYELRNFEINLIKENIIKYIPHELRTPLVSILGLSDLLLHEPNKYSEKEIIDIAAQINKSGLRLYNTIEKFLLLVELTSEHLISNESIETLEAKKTITSIINNIKIPVERKNDIEINLEKSNILFSERYLSIALNELLNNSVKFSNLKTKIEVTGTIKNAHYLLEIKDYGIGMSKTELLEIDAFKQFNRNEFQQEGNGLGLAIVKQIINNMNSKLNIESEPGKYTKVNLFLQKTNEIINTNVE